MRKAPERLTSHRVVPRFSLEQSHFCSKRYEQARGWLGIGLSERGRIGLLVLGVVRIAPLTSAFTGASLRTFSKMAKTVRSCKHAPLIYRNGGLNTRATFE